MTEILIDSISNFWKNPAPEGFPYKVAIEGSDVDTVGSISLLYTYMRPLVPPDINALRIDQSLFNFWPGRNMEVKPLDVGKSDIYKGYELTGFRTIFLEDKRIFISSHVSKNVDYSRRFLLPAIILIADKLLVD